MKGNIKIGVIGHVERHTFVEEKELMEVIQKYNNGEYPMITEFDFCACLFSFMKLQGMYEFDISKLEEFIQEKLDLEKFRLIFADIDSQIVIQEGISAFEITSSVRRDLNSFSHPKARIYFSREQAEEFVANTAEIYQTYIEQFAIEFQNDLLFKRDFIKSLGERRLK